MTSNTALSTQYNSAKDNLKALKNLTPKLQKKVNTLLAETDAIHAAQKISNEDDIQTLIEVLEGTQRVLSNLNCSTPSPQKWTWIPLIKETAPLQKYLALAEEVSGRSSFLNRSWQALGATMIGLGMVLASLGAGILVASLAFAVPTVGGSTVAAPLGGALIGAGVLLSAIGAGLWGGNRRKGLSKAMVDLAGALPTPP